MNRGRNNLNDRRKAGSSSIACHVAMPRSFNPDNGRKGKGSTANLGKQTDRWKNRHFIVAPIWKGRPATIGLARRGRNHEMIIAEGPQSKRFFVTPHCPVAVANCLTLESLSASGISKPLPRSYNSRSSVTDLGVQRFHVDRGRICIGFRLDAKDLGRPFETPRSPRAFSSLVESRWDSIGARFVIRFPC